MTFKLITDMTHTIIYRSCIRFPDVTTPNQHIEHPLSQNFIPYDPLNNVVLSDKDTHGVVDLNDLYETPEDSFDDHCHNLCKIMVSSLNNKT